MDIKEGSPKANKASQLESTGSIKAKVQYSLKYFVVPVEGCKELCIYVFFSSVHHFLELSPPLQPSPSPPPPPMADVVVSFDCIGKLQ